MKLSVMSYTLARQYGSNFDFVAMCKLAQELHIDGVDMVTTYKRDPQEIRRLLDDHGLKTVCHTIMPKLGAATFADRVAGVDIVKQGVDAAVTLGTDKIMIVTPGVATVPRDLTRRYIIRGLQESAALARQAGITVTIENFPGEFSPFDISSDIQEAVREVPGLKLTYDNGNIFVGGENPAVSFERCAAFVAHAHFKDWDRAPGGRMVGLDGWRYDSALIGEGVLDHKACLEAMKKGGYAGYINIEYEGSKYPAEEATRRAAKYLRGLMPEL